MMIEVSDLFLIALRSEIDDAKKKSKGKRQDEAQWLHGYCAGIGWTMNKLKEMKIEEAGDADAEVQGEGDKAKAEADKPLAFNSGHRAGGCDDSSAGHIGSTLDE